MKCGVTTSTLPTSPSHMNQNITISLRLWGPIRNDSRKFPGPGGKLASSPPKSTVVDKPREDQTWWTFHGKFRFTPLKTIPAIPEKLMVGSDDSLFISFIKNGVQPLFSASTSHSFIFPPGFFQTIPRSCALTLRPFASLKTVGRLERAWALRLLVVAVASLGGTVTRFPPTSYPSFGDFNQPIWKIWVKFGSWNPQGSGWKYKKTYLKQRT